MIESYRTIAERSEGSFKDKGSKFFAYAFPVKNENEIKDCLKELKKIHHDARHHCYAWRLGAAGGQYRINDDQEPAGTAGKPIFGQLLSYEVTNVLLVVVRYFGGTLLGTGGLIQAYRQAAQDALQKASVVEKQVTGRIVISFSYPVINEVMKIIKHCGAEITDQELELTCRIEVSIPLRNLDDALEKISRINGAAAETIKEE